MVTQADDPKYAQVVHYLRGQIGDGTLKVGAQLPSFVELRQQFGISRTTIEKAFSLLERESLIIRQRGRGTFVSQSAERPSSKSRGCGTIGVLGEMFSQRHASLYWSHLLAGIRHAAHDVGLEVTLLRDGAGMTGWEKVDGVLVSSQWVRPIFLDKPLHLPYVELLFNSPYGLGVYADDAAGTHEAVQHLLKLGHRRIGYLLLEDRPVLEGRYRAYEAALSEAQLTPCTRWIKPPPLQKDYFLRLGENSMNQWLDDESSCGWKASGCTALMCQNDQMAIGAMVALAAHGLEVPSEVSVVGFDGTELSDYCSPRLTTIRVPLEEIGAHGVEMLLQQIEERGLHGNSIISPIMLPTELKYGASTAPP